MLENLLCCTMRLGARALNARKSASFGLLIEIHFAKPLKLLFKETLKLIENLWRVFLSSIL